MFSCNKYIVPYKEIIKGSDEFTVIKTRLIVIQDVLCSGLKKGKAAHKYGCCRNTITNILRLFREEVPSDIKDAVLSRQSFSKEEILNQLFMLARQSTAPKGHSRSANEEQENLVVEFHKKLGFGYARLLTHINRTVDGADGRIKDVKDCTILKDLTEAQMKGIYKRKNLKTKKRKAASGKRKPLYDYSSIGAFEYLHYDTKEVTDLKALPIDIYNKFKDSSELPVREWNIIDACSRFRFIAWSRGLSSEFGFHFLVCVLQFIRARFPCMRDQRITVGFDNGCEFCSSSVTKEMEWNVLLSPLNACVYSYHPNFDVRKNLIERSHKSDDEEFLVPKGTLIKDLKSFLKEADAYKIYWNSQRSHSGLGMNKMTPVEKLKSRGLKGAKRLLDFPTMLLEDTIGELRKGTEVLQAIHRLEEKIKAKKTIDQKQIYDIGAMYKGFFSQPYAQNVLTQYQEAYDELANTK